MSNFGFCLSICLFFVSLWNFKAYVDIGDVKNGIMSILLLGAAFHCLYLGSSFEKNVSKKCKD